MLALGGRYRLDARIGRGGMAEVFRGWDQVLHREVAIKMFRPGSAGDAGVPGPQAEARILAGLNHPNLVAVYDAHLDNGASHPYGVTDADSDSSRPRTAGAAYLVMELVPGPSVAERLTRGPLLPAEVAHIGAGVAAALDFVHHRGLVHRDVKPANILLRVDGVAKLTDFGIAQFLADPDATADGVIAGTAAYLSPEQVHGTRVGPPSDIYSLALVLLEACTGSREYPGPPVEAATARLTRAPHLPTWLPEPVRDLLSAMTAHDPADRPTAAQVSARCTRWAAEATHGSHRPHGPVVWPGAASIAAAH